MSAIGVQEVKGSKRVRKAERCVLVVTRGVQEEVKGSKRVREAERCVLVAAARCVQGEAKGSKRHAASFNEFSFFYFQRHLELRIRRLFYCIALEQGEGLIKIHSGASHRRIV